MATIVQRLATLQIARSEELEVIIELVFKKALAEPHYCETYADLIFSLTSFFLSSSSSSSLAPVDAGDEELELERKKSKERMLANMKLIGHLFLRQLLPAKVLATILRELVPCDASSVPEEYMLECACELLMSTGHALESLPRGGHVVQQVLGRLAELKNMPAQSCKSACSKRVSFVIQDLLDARAAGWTKKSFKSSAKTKEEVRMEQQRDLSAQMRGESFEKAETVVAGLRPQYLRAIGA